MTNIKSIFSTMCWILVCQFLLASCSNFDDSLPVDIGEDYVNKQILLRAPDFFNTFKTKDVIYLELKYNSSNKIVFPNDYNFRIFEKTAEGWIEIFEIPTERLPAGDIVLSPTKERPLVEAIFVAPDLEDYAQRYQLRIYVIGDMETDEGNKKVAAYADLELHP